MRVDDLQSNRWPAALDLLCDGRGRIELGDLVSITWWTHGVGADARVRVDIYSSGDPRFVTRSKALREITEGRELVDAAGAAHPRLQRLLDEEPVCWEYVYDYGKGSVRIATVSDGGAVDWAEELRGVEYGDQSGEA